MPYRAEPSGPDKAKAITAVAALYALMIGALLLVRNDSAVRMADNEPTVLIDVNELPPPQPPPKTDPGKAEEEEGAAGKKAEPTPVVAPKPRVVVPAKPPVAAAPIPGTGSASTAGAATAGIGPGAGGSGTGRGGGGSGGGGGIGAPPRLLGGNQGRVPSHLLRGFAANRGQAILWLTVSESGRVTRCSVFQTSGQTPVDDALCNLMATRSRWAPARDTQGQPTAVTFRYVATWSKD